jgi:hypothetical protein
MEGEAKDDIELRIEKECDIIVISICFLEIYFLEKLKILKKVIYLKRIIEFKSI